MNRKEKEQLVTALIARDGYRCMMPGCTRPFTEDDKPTIDHWIPFSISKDGTLANLVLMHFSCNNLKGDTIPNDDGTINIIRRTRIPKEARPELCDTCMSGRLLLDGELCPDCGSGPQPAAYPTAYKKKPKNCSHEGREHCWACVTGLIKRVEIVV